MKKRVVLKPGKEKSVIANRHPWIFSGAIAQAPSFENGEILPVYSHQGEFLAQAYFHTQNSIAGRVLSYTLSPIEQVIEEKLIKALRLRESLVLSSDTNCYRLINAEGDGLPGLVIDVYDTAVVLQVNTWGIERLKPLILQKIKKLLSPTLIYEKSLSSARLLDGLAPLEGVIEGQMQEEILVKENGIVFAVRLSDCQKTGLFLDQREMRAMIGSLAKGRRVLNCFSYSAGFSLYALQYGALDVTSVDIAKSACDQAKRNTLLNGFSLERHTILEEDVFAFLTHKESFEQDLIILDPPAFAKKRNDVPAATQGYKRINAEIMRKAKPNTLLLSCSCSYFIDRSLFQHSIFQAASEAGRSVRILQHHISAYDHPISLYHPEGDYLKSLLLHIE